MTERPPAPILHMKYRRFCAEYLKDFDCKRAAEVCGFDPRRVGALLRSWRIVTTLAEMSQKILDQPMEILKNRIKQEYEAIAFANPTEILGDDNQIDMALTREHGRKLQKMRVQRTTTQNEVTEQIIEVQYHDKMAALAQLAKYTGLVSDAKKLELTGKDGAPIQFVFPE